MAKNNILDLYEGLSKQEAQQFSNLIYPTLAAVREQIHNPTGDKTMFYNQPVSITEETIAEVVRQALHNLSLTRSQTAQREAADLGEIESELEDVSSQLQPLLKFPSANRQQIARLKAKSDELWAQHQQATAQVKAAGTAQVQAQRAQIEAQLQPLTEEYNVISKQPTKYAARIKELTAAMNPLYAQLDGLK